MLIRERERERERDLTSGHLHAGGPPPTASSGKGGCAGGRRSAKQRRKRRQEGGEGRGFEVSDPGSSLRTTSRATYQIEALDEYYEIVVTIFPIRARWHVKQGRKIQMNSDPL